MGLKSAAFSYALRRTLPPWSFAANLEELATLREAKVEEVIVKVDTEEFSHGQIPLDFLRAYQDKLFAIRRKLDELGIRYSLNPWITQGHVDRGRHVDMQLPGIQTMIDIDGTPSTACACPLSEVWQENTREAWKLYAETQPYVMWVEDDIRSFNHGAVHFACFCPLHMARFSTLAGRPVTREELAAALLAPGKPHPWRALYFAMQREIMIETATMLSRTVHRYSPQTRMGLMSSGPRNHTMEGRDWRRFAQALADGQPLHSRPATGVYQEFSLRDNYWGMDNFLLTRQMLPAGTRDESEIDNWSFTRYAKSVTYTGLQLTSSAAFGCCGATLNLYDHAGTLMAEEPEMGLLLKQAKPYLDSLRSLLPENGRYRGVQLLFSDRYAEMTHLPEGASPDAFREPGVEAAKRLNIHGINVVYTDEPCRVAAGESIRAFSDAQIEAMLGARQGLFLDAEAAGILLARGFGDKIGVKKASPLQKLTESGIFSAEEFYRPEFGGAPHKFMNLFVTGSEGQRWSYMEFLPGSVEISRLVGPDLEVLSAGTVLFENAAGGRVAVSTQSLNDGGDIYCNTHRREELEAVFDYLSFGAMPVRLRGDGVYPQLFRCDSAEQICSGFFNLSMDVWTCAGFQLTLPEAGTYEAMELQADGTLKKIASTVQGGKMSVTLTRPVAPGKAGIVVLQKK